MIASPFGDVRMRGFARRVAVAEFQALVRERTAPLGAEPVPIGAAAGRVLAEPVTAGRDVPPFVRSAMDGYALRGEETFGASEYNPLTFKVVGEVTPGRFFEGAVSPGECVRIMTGAPLPEGTDGVLMAEYSEERSGTMTASQAVAPGRNTGRIGEDIRRGQPLLPRGRRLRPQDLGVLASVAVPSIPVYRRARVSLIVTGNELVKPGETPRGAQIVDSNSIMLAALIARDGGEVAETLHLKDERETIRQALLAATGDLIVLTGGTSVGVEDHAPGLIAEEGELLAHGVAMRPSAPTGLGALGGSDARLVFLLPGNPVSCLAAYDFFVGLAVRRLGGLPDGWPYAFQNLRLRERIASQIGRVDYARVGIERGEAVLLATSGASVLSSTTRAGGFVVVDEDSEGMAAGDEARVWLYDAPAGEPA